jgi:DNA polymerase II large subunit
MHAKYRLKKNFLAQPETNLSSHFALNVASSPCEREHRRYPLAVFCRCGASPHAREITVLSYSWAVMSITQNETAILERERHVLERFTGP